VRSQVLFALVQLEIPEKLLHTPAKADKVAADLGLDVQRTEVLLRAGVGIGVLRKHVANRYTVSQMGAALCGVPGLRQMILHHGAFYQDMADPVALLTGDAPTEVSKLWPYVFGAGSTDDPETAKRYSDLMAESQTMVAKDTLQTVKLHEVKRLLDIGGGTGAFLTEVANAYPNLKLDLMDLPAVEPAAMERLKQHAVTNRINFHAGSFRDDPLPGGVDAVSLIRVLYDHDDETVAALLAKIFDLLPKGGRLIISEPMSGGVDPDPITDVYFAFYTTAMRTGRTRSAKQIGRMCRDAGFQRVEMHKPKRSYVTSVISAVKKT